MTKNLTNVRQKTSQMQNIAQVRTGYLLRLSCDGRLMMVQISRQKQKVSVQIPLKFDNGGAREI